MNKFPKAVPTYSSEVRRMIRHSKIKYIADLDENGR